LDTSYLPTSRPFCFKGSLIWAKFPDVVDHMPPWKCPPHWARPLLQPKHDVCMECQIPKTQSICFNKITHLILKMLNRVKNHFHFTDGETKALISPLFPKYYK
jgi:hypothetical protein